MSQLIQQLTTAGEAHRGTDLGGLLQWAALHIGDQDVALADVRDALARSTTENQKLNAALATATASVESALADLKAPVCPEIEFSRDLTGHINLMAGHGDPDYLKADGKSVRHVDLRQAKPRAMKGNAS